MWGNSHHFPFKQLIGEFLIDTICDLFSQDSFQRMVSVALIQALITVWAFPLVFGHMCVNLPATLPLPAPSLAAPACHVKTVHFVRHGLALHNIASQGCDDAHVFDAPLVSFGTTQAEDLGEVWAESVTRVDVIVSSPMRRTLQTATFLRNALAAKKTIDVIVLEDAREHFTGCTDATRMDTALASEAFPGFIFDSSMRERDPFKFPEDGSASHYEDHQSLHARADRFVRALGDRPEAHIIAVSHAMFIWRSIDRAIEQGWVRVVPSLPKRVVYDQGPHFSNCQVASYELRSEF